MMTARIDKYLWTNNDVHPIIDFLSPVDCLVMSTASKTWQTRLCGPVYLKHIREYIKMSFLKHIDRDLLRGVRVQNTDAVFRYLETWSRATLLRWLRICSRYERKQNTICAQCGSPLNGHNICRACVWPWNDVSLTRGWKFTKEQLTQIPQLFVLIKYDGSHWARHSYLTTDLLTARLTMPWLDVKQMRMKGMDKMYYDTLPKVVRDNLRIEQRGATTEWSNMVMVCSDELRLAQRERMKKAREGKEKSVKTYKRRRTY